MTDPPDVRLRRSRRADRLQLLVGDQSLRPELAAEAGSLDATEWRSPGPAPSYSRLGGLRERREVMRERQRGFRLAASSPLENYLFRILGRDQKLSVDGAARAQLVARSGRQRRRRWRVCTSHPSASFMRVGHSRASCLPRLSWLSNTNGRELPPSPVGPPRDPLRRASERLAAGKLPPGG